MYTDKMKAFRDQYKESDAELVAFGEEMSAEKNIINSIGIIDYKGDENTRNSNKVRSKINKYYLKKNAN